DSFTKKRMVVHRKNANQARVGAHDCRSFETVGISSAPTSVGRLAKQQRPVELLFRLPFRSKHPVLRPSAVLALERLANPNVRGVCLPPAPAGPFRVHRPARATAVGLRRTKSQPRFDAPVSGGTHSVTLRARCGSLHPG